MALAIGEGRSRRHRCAIAGVLGVVAWLGGHTTACATPSAGGLGRLETGWLNGFGKRADESMGRAPLRYLGYGGLALRGMFGERNVQFAGGLDIGLGAASPAGFFYTFVLRPGGVAFVADDVLRFSVTGGVGFDGASPSLPIAGRFPVETLLELRLGQVTRLELAGEFAWLVSDASREVDSRVLGTTGETTLAARVRFGSCCNDWSRLTSGSGTFVGFVLTERTGTWLAGSVLGHSFDLLWTP